MNLTVVNEDANFIIQLYVDNKWQTLTKEYSVSTANDVMTNACVLTKYKGRVLSERSNNILISEYE
jgi:hypothetical protein